jgi:hypothetical protein
MIALSYSTFVTDRCNLERVTADVGVTTIPARHALVQEILGYIVWGLTAAVIAIPEIWAAVDGKHVPWPTISGTVGYIEYWHTWVATIVIAILVWAAFHSVKYSRGVGGGGRTPGGRYVLGTPAATPIRNALAGAYYLVALASVIAGPLIVADRRPHDKYLLGEVLYGLIGLFGVLVPSLVGLIWKKDVPFPTLFWTIQKLESRLRLIAIIFAAGITVLLLHLALYPWPEVIPDLQNLHNKNQTQPHHQKKQREPSPYSQ